MVSLIIYSICNKTSIWAAAFILNHCSFNGERIITYGKTRAIQLVIEKVKKVRMFKYNPIHKELSREDVSPSKKLELLIDQGYISNLVQVDSDAMMDMFELYI